MSYIVSLHVETALRTNAGPIRLSSKRNSLDSRNHLFVEGIKLESTAKLTVSPVSV